MQADLMGTVALVTGASSGIGRATAHRLAQRGATVAALARRAEALELVCSEIRSDGGEAFPVQADLTDPAEAAHAVTRVTAATGRLDMLVNCAGTALLGPFAAHTPAHWQALVDTNLTGTLNVSQPALQHLAAAAAASWGRKTADLVTVGSTAGRRSKPNASVYAATKHAVTAWSDALRAELAPVGVRVSVVQPGVVDTPLARDLGADPDLALAADEVADAIVYVVTRPAGVTVTELVVRAASG